jgi:hypothetical protein
MTRTRGPCPNAVDTSVANARPMFSAGRSSLARAATHEPSRMRTTGNLLGCKPAES